MTDNVRPAWIARETEDGFYFVAEPTLRDGACRCAGCRSSWLYKAEFNSDMTGPNGWRVSEIALEWWGEVKLPATITKLKDEEED